MKRLLFIALVLSLAMACRTTQAPQEAEESTTEEKTEPAATAPESSDQESKASAQPVASTPSCEPVEMASPIPEKTSAEFEAFRKKAKSIGKKVSEELGRETWAIRPSKEGSASEQEAARVEIAEICGGWVGEPVPKPGDGYDAMGECLVEFQLGGGAAAIEYISECGGDSCSSTHHVWRRDQSAPVKVDQNADFVNVAPGAEFVYYSAEGTAPIDFYTYRSKLDGSDECIVTRECFSPRISPDGSYLLCRNFEAEVLKLSTGEGALETIAPPNLPEGHVVYIRKQWGEFPQPVEFIDEKRIKYTIAHEKAPAPSERQTKEVTLSLP